MQLALNRISREEALRAAKGTVGNLGLQYTDAPATDHRHTHQLGSISGETPNTFIYIFLEGPVESWIHRISAVCWMF